MSLGHGASIIRNGLVLHLDAANTKSYPGSGDTWTDLTGNGYNGIRTGSNVSYSALQNAFEFSGSGSDTSSGIYIQNLNYANGDGTEITNLTIESWLKCNSATSSHTNDQRMVLSFDRSAVFRFGIGHDVIAGSDGIPCFSDSSGGSGIGDDSASSYNGDLRDDEWHQVCVTFSSSAVKYYIDGNLVHTTSGSFSPIIPDIQETPRYGWIGNGSEATTAGGTITPGDLFYGFISTLRYYYNTLTDAEIKQNFNAIRGRYGL